MRVRFALIALLCGVLGCGQGESDDALLTIRYSDALRCRPMSPPQAIVVEALGDFPASDSDTIEVLEFGGVDLIDRFPTDTALVRLGVSGPDWLGGGTRSVRLSDGQPSMGPILVLPADRECVLADPALAVLDDAVVALPGGGVVLLGGQEGGLARRRVVRLRAGATLGELDSAGLAVARVGASALSVGDDVLVLGGGLGTTGPAHDTYERLPANGLREPAVGTLGAPRRDFGALAVAESVYLVGGQTTAEGPALDTAERLDLATDQSTPIAPLPIARVSPTLFRLDDGRIVAAGGRAATGAFVGDVFVYSIESDRWTEISEARFPSLPDPQIVPLPGSRFAVVASAREGRSSSVVRLVRLADAAIGFEDVDFSSQVPPLSDVRAVALLDGRILLTGDDGLASRAFLLDLGRADAVELQAVDTPERLVLADDGLIVGLGAAGASLRRPTPRSVFDNPPATTLPSDLTLDGSGRFSVDGVVLRALVDNARADLAGLRFAAFEVELDAQGAAEMLLVRDDQEPVRVSVGSTRVGIPLCEIDRAEGAPIRMIRTRDELVFEVGDTRQRCVVEGLSGRLGVAFRLLEGASVGPIRVARL